MKRPTANPAIHDSPPFRLTSLPGTIIETCMGRKKILIIEDEEDTVKLTSKRFRKAGYEVACHREGRGAIDAVKATRPDVILLDIWLPGINGIDIFKQLRADEALKSIPIVFFSASISDEDTCVRDLGAEGFVKKPFESARLLDVVNDVVEGRRGR